MCASFDTQAARWQGEAQSRHVKENPAEPSKPTQLQSSLALSVFLSSSLALTDHTSQIDTPYPYRARINDTFWGIAIDKAWRHPQSMVPLLDAE